MKPFFSGGLANPQHPPSSPLVLVRIVKKHLHLAFHVPEAPDFRALKQPGFETNTPPGCFMEGLGLPLPAPEASGVVASPNPKTRGLIPKTTLLNAPGASGVVASPNPKTRGLIERFESLWGCCIP